MTRRYTAVSSRLDAISRLIRQGLAAGDIFLEFDYDADDFSLPSEDRLSINRKRKGPRTLVTIELELYDYQLDFLDEIPTEHRGVAVTPSAIPRCTCAVGHLTGSSCELHSGLYGGALHAEPIPDYRGAVDTLVKIIQVIEKAEASKWAVIRLVEIIRVALQAATMDDTSKRFRMLELD